MSVFDLWATLNLHYAPSLPSTQSLVWARYLVWSVVMAAVGMALALRISCLPRWTRHLPWALALWAWVPGSWGLSYWLGLAFQIPSLSAGVLALSVLLQSPARRAPASNVAWRGQGWWTVSWAGLAFVSGSVLLLDTFAVFDFSVYQWGFSPMALVLALAIALLPWVVSGEQGLRQPAVWSLLAALTVFLLTRWPTGNVWDAVLDPFLWMLALAYLLRRPWRKA